MMGRLRSFFGQRRDDPVPPRPTSNELFYWRSPKGVNFGDYLSSVIVARMLGERAFFLDEQVSRPRRLLAIGSILHFARNGDVVWGSGVNGKVSPERHDFDRIDVRAVRGPLTRDFLKGKGIRCPQVYGDPGILVARLLARRFATGSPRKGVSFVPNLHDLPLMEGWPNLISPLDPWAQVVARIATSEHVISSSLHGLVVADAFGVPCSYLRLSETENILKYEDYVLGVGRDGLTVHTSREEALRRAPMSEPKPDLDALMSAFPYDLWE